MKPHILAILYFVLLPTLACSQNKQSDLQPSRSNQTELLVTNAKIWTADPEHREAQALLIRDGRFLYVGKEQDARAKAKKNAQIIDAQGRRILPGLIDSHLHLIDGGLQLSRINLRDVPDRTTFIENIKRRAAQTLNGQWIQGGRWSTESWPDPTQPRKEWIDAITSNNPVLLSRMDGHGALANSVALEKAGISRNGPPDPPGGQIERDPTTGEPTGILKDSAIELVSKLIPKPTDAELDAALEAAVKHANLHGITSVHTMSEYSHLAAFDRAREKRKLTVRVRQYISEEDWQGYVHRALAHSDDDWVSVTGFKAYADGSLGSRTAWMSKPFNDNSRDNANWSGLSRLDDNGWDAIVKACTWITPQELAPAIHAIGDAAIEKVTWFYAGLNFTCVLRQDGAPPPDPAEQRAEFQKMLERRRRWPRIEHAQHLTAELIKTIASEGIVASMQPLHKADDARYAEKAIGPQRCKTSYAFRSLLDAGALVAFGSDWPVVSLDPFLGVRAAVTGLSLDNKVFVPEQNITVEEALTCYTRNAARAAGDQATLGMIREGYLADFVILDQDPFTTDPKSLGEFHGDTYVAGKLVGSSTARSATANRSELAYPPDAEPDRLTSACRCCDRTRQSEPGCLNSADAKSPSKHGQLSIAARRIAAD